MRSLALCCASLCWPTAILASDTDFQQADIISASPTYTVDLISMGPGNCDVSIVDIKGNRYPNGVYSKPNISNFDQSGHGIFIFANPELSKKRDFSYRGKTYSIKCFSLFLFNLNENQIDIPSTDNRLFLTCEALDKNGNWSPIEYIEHSYCGNSYYTIPLPAKNHWEFSVPAYSGNYKTKLRYRLQLSPDRNLSYFPKTKGLSDIYSNIFDGSINPEQFTIDYRYDGRILDTNRFEMSADGKTRILKFRN